MTELEKLKTAADLIRENSQGRLELCASDVGCAYVRASNDAYIAMNISQSYKLTAMQKSGIVDPDIFISKSNQLAEQLRQAKQQKERLQHQEEDGMIEATLHLVDLINAGPVALESFNEELFCELIDKIVVESNTRIRFRLNNGLELPETIERTNR